MKRRRSFSDTLGDARNSLAEGLAQQRREILESLGQQQAERWTVHQVQFSEHARMAARRALWFLRLVEPDSDDDLRKHVQEGARHQLEPVLVPDKSQWCRPETPRERCVHSGAIELKFSKLIEQWRQLLTRLQSPATPSVAELREVENAIVLFIRRSRPLDPFIRFTYSFAPAVRHFLAQHGAMLAALLVGFAVCAGVEAVRSLLLNEPRFTLIVLVAALAPQCLLYLGQRALHARGRAAPWNLGGRVVHAIPVSVEPERWRPWHPDGYVGRVYLSLLLKTALHVALWILLGWLLAALIRVLDIDGVWLTVYLVVMLWALFVLLGGVIDFADVHSPSPLRAILLAGTVFVFTATILSDSTAVALAVMFAWLGVMAWWSVRVENSRVMAVPTLLLIVSLVTVGITQWRRSDDVWRTDGKTTELLTSSEWPRGDRSSGPVVVLAASGGGSRAAILTARTLAAIDSSLPTIAANLQAISSVSGGSLANAAYVARRLQRAGLVSASASPVCEESLGAAVKRDFLQPTLLGIWRPGGRGLAIQNAWENCPVGLRGVTIGMLASAWRSSKDGAAPFPVPLFNSVSLERNAVVISPFAQSFFASAFDDEARSPDSNAYRRHATPTWVYYRSGIYHLKDLSDGMDASLSAAVRASANFPFGFPLVEVEARKPQWYSTLMADRRIADTARRIVRLTDGGALSNSGMWPLVPLLVNQRERIGDDRGVLVIVVDASRMPGPPWTDRQRGLLATLLDKNPKGERLHFQMLEQLATEYGDCFGYVHVGIQPTPRYNVYTTWALDRGSLEVVDSAFADAWKTAGPRMQEEYERLKTCDNGGVNRGRPKRLRPGRVPLS